MTRLSDGSSVELSAAKIERGVQEKLGALEREGCDVILLLCTGTFHGLHCPKSWLVEPDQIIPPVAAALLQNRLLGIIVPLPQQMHSESGKWRGLARTADLCARSPYTEDSMP